MSFPGGIEWLVILLVVVLLFGAKKIPDLAKGIGSGIREFRKASKEEMDKDKNEKLEDKKSDSEKKSS